MHANRSRNTQQKERFTQSGSLITGIFKFSFYTHTSGGGGGGGGGEPRARTAHQRELSLSPLETWIGVCVSEQCASI